MCRLYGNIGKSTIDQFQFERLTLLSKSGGPDHTGYYSDNHCQFGFNRLSILDTSERGSQPILSPTGRYVLMLNGEVYNFKELSKSFNLKGLRSGSDAEVVAHLLEELDFDTLVKNLNGMFAICVWDKLTNELFLARDFAGIKPLFFGHNDSGLVFGSQFDQILYHPWFQGWSWSESGLREYLQFGYMEAPFTVAEHVYQLSPGTYLRYDFATKTQTLVVYQQFFGKDTAKHQETDPFISHTVHNVLKESVNRQLLADVPLGVFLSGGVDSTLIAAIASKSRPDLETLTVGFEDKVYDESEKAAEYAKLLGLKNRKIIFTEQDLLSLFEAHNQAMTEPIADYSTLPTYLISKVASSTFKVMLSGDGGDELFWGYPRFRTFANSAPYFKLPGSGVRRFARKAMKGAGLDITGFLSEENLGKANLAFHSYLPSKFLDRLWPDARLSDDFLSEFLSTDTIRENALLYLRRNEFYRHLQKILIKVDRMSMANGLEVRVPILDKSVLKTAETVLPSMLNGHNDLKWMLKRILGMYLPENQIPITKQGFTPPLKIWSRTCLRSHISEKLSAGSALQLPFENWKGLMDYGQGYLNGQHNNLEGLWTIYSLLSWKMKLG